MKRRRLFKGLVALLGWGLSGLGGAETRVATKVANAFSEVNHLAGIEVLLGARPLNASAAIDIEIDGIAEDGSIVPLKITVALENVSAVSIFAPKNPVPLVAHFELSRAVHPYLATRIKLAESENVLVIVEASGQLFSAKKYVQVMRGGCS